MSLVTHRHLKHVRPQSVPARTGPEQITFLGSLLLQPAVTQLRKAIASGAKLLAHAVQAVAEARMHRTMIEAELYRGRTKLSSKNDDDLPVVRRIGR